MKKLVLLLVFILGVGSLSIAQVVVKVRPAKPKVLVVKPTRPGPNYLWVDGHWKWNARKGRYVWRKGHWVKKRRGQIYMAGYWRQSSGGHVWVAGRWIRR